METKDQQFLTLKHYKEPLTSIPESKGYGYYGAICVTIDGTKIQCHICGKLFSDVSAHARQAHKINLSEYRETFMLSPTTALISESERHRRKELTLAWIKTLSEEKKQYYRKLSIEGRAKRGNFQPKESLELKNKKGTCPDQLLAKIHEVASKIGRTPTLAEFITETGGQRYKHLILTTFGTWLNALKMAKLKPEERKDGGGFRHYSSEELLEYLSIFAQENRKIPTATDCKRGLLPDYGVFQRRFGTFEKARQLAGVYQFVE